MTVLQGNHSYMQHKELIQLSVLSVQQVPEEIPYSSADDLQASKNCSQGFPVEERDLEIQHCLQPCKSEQYIQHLQISSNLI